MTWTPEMQAWHADVMARAEAKPLTVFQVDLLKSEFRKVKL